MRLILRSRYLPVGWSSHLLVGCQLQGVNHTENLTVWEGGETNSLSDTDEDLLGE